MTEGPTSPFFFYFTFALISATLHWQWRGTLWTALAMLSAFLGIGLYAEHVLHDPAFELHRFLMRAAYLAVVAVMLGYWSAYEARIQAALGQHGQRLAAMEERMSLARDLHDGVLQSLAATALRVERARREVETDPDAAGRNLVEVHRLMGAEQRELRALIAQLRPDPTPVSEPELALAARLEALGERIEGQWGLRAELGLEGDDERIPDRLAKEFCYLVQEALVNAVRHAHAARARVRVGIRAAALTVAVANDGRGYPFTGRYDLPALEQMNRDHDRSWSVCRPWGGRWSSIPAAPDADRDHPAARLARSRGVGGLGRPGAARQGRAGDGGRWDPRTVTTSAFPRSCHNPSSGGRLFRAGRGIMFEWS